MPEMHFTVRWPDGREESCYSPSLVVHDHLVVGRTYGVADFVERSSTALGIASDRVREKYGFACTSAEAQLAAIRFRADEYPEGGDVLVIAMEPPLPDGAGS